MKLQQHEITSPSQTYKLPGRMGIKSAAPAAVDTAPDVDAAVLNRSNLKIVPPRIIKMVKTVLQQSIQSVVLEISFKCRQCSNGRDQKSSKNLSHNFFSSADDVDKPIDSQTCKQKMRMNYEELLRAAK